MVDTKLHTIKLPYPDKGDRTVWIYVPSHSDGEKLPVVYMTDGQNLFDDNSTPHGSWEVVKAVENEQKSGVGNAVIVGIDNGNAWRDSELTPKSIGEVQHLEMFCEDFKPEGEIFDDFLMNTVIPYVENMPYLYIYTGNGDELEEMIFESTEMLYELLEESFYPYDRMNEVILFENAHNEKSWREIFPDFLHTFLSRL